MYDMVLMVIVAFLLGVFLSPLIMGALSILFFYLKGEGWR